MSLLILSSIPSTAAKERSRREVGVYSLYYGTTPQHLRPEALRKWMESVTSLSCKRLTVE